MGSPSTTASVISPGRPAANPDKDPTGAALRRRLTFDHPHDCARHPLLFVGGEIAVAPANRLRFGDLESGDVLMHGVPVVQLRVAVVENVVRTLRAQQVGVPRGPV